MQSAEKRSIKSPKGASPIATSCKTEATIDIADLRARCPMPVLLTRMGMQKYAKRTCHSPFRPDKKPSWGIFLREGRYYWKDHATGESGDEINFIVRARELTGPSAFPKALEYWQMLANKGPATPVELGPLETQPQQKPDASGFGPGTDEQIDRLAKLRKIDRQALLVAQKRGSLVFGNRCGHEVFGVRDSSGHVLEVRRLDGKPFPAFGDLAERKSHAIKGSRKNWPVGISDVGSKPMILMVEGLPDFLAAFAVVVREEALDRVAPVAMLAAGCSIATDALPLFKDKHVRIVPHADAPGTTGARHWKEQLLAAGAKKVDFFPLGEDDTSPIKDLNDYLPLHRLDVEGGSTEGRIL